MIRFNKDNRFPVGYGLKFTKIEPQAQASIQQLVDDANKRGDRGRFVK